MSKDLEIELAPEIEAWKAQGRDPEHVYGVLNFLSGIGGKGIKRLIVKRAAQQLVKLRWKGKTTEYKKEFSAMMHKAKAKKRLEKLSTERACKRKQNKVY